MPDLSSSACFSQVVRAVTTKSYRARPRLESCSPLGFIQSLQDNICWRCGVTIGRAKALHEPEPGKQARHLEGAKEVFQKLFLRQAAKRWKLEMHEVPPREAKLRH